jgi:APA family basic amino acid/polyamine antiporter
MTQQLKRELGIIGAVTMGLGSIIGTGVFVSIGIGAGIAGASVLLAIMLAAIVATMSGLNSAQLAANHPVSGGTYEYGYRYLNPFLGFTAGWMFLLAKSASAATAALGASSYLGVLLGWDKSLYIPVALSFVVVLVGIVLLGIRRSTQFNILIVAVTIGILLLFIVTGLPTLDTSNFTPFFSTTQASNESSSFSIDLFLQATALMFVAYTGYGRIATLGEEVREPKRTIPRAVIVALVSIMLLYVAVAVVAIGNGGADMLGSAIANDEAPLEIVAQGFSIAGIDTIVAIGALTAMLSVLLNLVLGLSRVLLAMGRRKDMPPMTAYINKAGTTPTVAVIIVGIIIAGLVLIGDMRLTWSFSAFNVLIYYALTNMSALQLNADERLFPRWIAWGGLFSCLFLASWVESTIWMIGLLLLGLGWLWFGIIKNLWQA